MTFKNLILAIICLSITACASTPPAPVIERNSSASQPNPTNIKPNNPETSGSDWRPNTYTVKKGDTLYAIGLEFGYDYKDIANANNLNPPYPIKIGQKLILPANGNNEKNTSVTAATESEEGVVVTPIKADPAPTDIKSTTPAVTPVLSQPKALREPFSQEALNRSGAKPSEVVSTKPAINPEPSAAKLAETKATGEDTIRWSWPTQGKVIASFNEASNKGIDIAGTMGQAVNAASSGKVIYSGSDLRGYGNLVIIKHNKMYLSVYAHNSKLMVKEGQMVSSGQKIAEMGNTDSNSVKLHFEIRQQGKSVDPAKYLPAY